jgi:predicted amidohydrolase
MKLSVLIGQFPISFNINDNLKCIINILEKAEPNDLVVVPEGALSGYSDDITFLKDINVDELEKAMEKLKLEVVRSNVHLIFGTCLFEKGSWYNTGICYSFNNNDFLYKKVNLATHERGYFKAGNELPVFKLSINDGSINIGIQLCREIRFPEQWRWLALNKTDIFVYLANAINGKNSSIWRSHLVSRAVENQRFLISSNNAHKNQLCPTMLIAPNGEIVDEILSEQFRYFRREIDFDNNSNWYISQMRNDVIRLISEEDNKKI